MTGKTGRMIRSKASEAWEQPGAPRHLKPPLQNILYHGARIRIEVMQDLMQEYIDTAERISPLINL